MIMKKILIGVLAIVSLKLLINASLIRNPFYHRPWEESEKEFLYQRDNWHHHYTIGEDGNWRVEYVEQCPNGSKKWHCGGKTYSDEDLQAKPVQQHVHKRTTLDKIMTKIQLHGLHELTNALKNPESK